MNKFLKTLIIFSSLPLMTWGQELKCNVQIVSQQVQGTNKQVFETLQSEIYEYMNNRVWTNHVFSIEERIECNIMFNITEQLSADEFRGTLQVQSRRPIFNTNYNTVMLNYMDNDIQFRYIEFEPLEFDMNSYISNLTSILSFYAYVILALDYDSFSPEGGTALWEAAERIVDNAQNAQEKGWKPFDNTSHRNRYWLVKDFIDTEYAPCREFLYRYHRLGLDLMDSKVNEGRAEISNSFELLQKVFRQKPDPFLQPLHLIFDAKSDEIVSIYSESFPDERSRVSQILNEIDQANANKYKSILENQN
ncbi:MAG: DUF4835 family protein [Bacteroidales bacterium]|nr:DUF4835 family protein [Bacteroidales bacterium]